LTSYFKLPGHSLCSFHNKFSNDFDIKSNCKKSVAMHIRKWLKEKCVLLQVDNKDILYVTELKYLGVYVCAGQLLKFSAEHLRSKFYRTFNCIYSRSKASNSEMISIELLFFSYLL